MGGNCSKQDCENIKPKNSESIIDNYNSEDKNYIDPSLRKKNKSKKKKNISSKKRRRKTKRIKK